MAETDRPGPPQRVGVTVKFLAENQARQRAYEERRRMWTEPFRPSRPRAQASCRVARTREGQRFQARQARPVETDRGRDRARRQDS